MPTRVLCFASYYLPGFRSGGPVRSLVNLVDWLGQEFEFTVVSRNRDLGMPNPYAGRKAGQWYEVGGARISYLDSPYWAPGPLRRLVDSVQPDLLYLNSFLDPCLAITPLLLRRTRLIWARTPVLLAPRGELSPGALSLKPAKKQAWLAGARMLGLGAGIRWHATSEEEAGDIRRWAGAGAEIHVASNLPRRHGSLRPGEARPRTPGSLRLVFLSRVSRKKNLDGALRMLAGVRSNVVFDVYGMLEDRAYWAECQAIIRALPPNITVRYCGVVEPDAVIATFAGYDAMLFPTLGENYGHALVEALLAGCPVITSDATPWRDLADARAGVDLPLASPDAFVATIERFAAMTQSEYAAWSAGARALGLRATDADEIVQSTRRMLNAAARP